MYAARCSHCGRPISVSVAQPAFSQCAGCDERTHHDPALVERLRECGRLLGSVDARSRQLTRAHRRAVGVAEWSRWTFIAAFALATGPLVALLLCCLTLVPDGGVSESYSMVLIGVTPLGVFLTGVSMLFVWMRRAGRKLAHACAALPPVVEGGRARCFVCGGPLDVVLDVTAANQASTRCGYCKADNVVNPEVLSRMTEDSVSSLGDLEGAVRTQSGLSTVRTVMSLGCIALLFVISPCTCFIPFAAVEPISVAMMNPVHSNIDYVVLLIDDEACIATVSGDTRRARHDHRTAVYPSGPTFTADALIGHTVRGYRHEPPHELRVEAIVGILGARSNAVLIDGETWGHPRVETLCLTDGPGDLPTLIAPADVQ